MALAPLAWFNRERRLIRRYRLLSVGGAGDQPQIVLKDERRPVTIVSAPSEADPCWTVSNGRERRRIRTADIVELDTARCLSGYAF